MRNFYLTADIDGRQTLLTGGPRAKDGGMTIELRQRDNGISVVSLYVRCFERNGKLVTKVIFPDGFTHESDGLTHEFVTER